MTSSEDSCNLNSLLSMPCRQRAEAFANRLRTRLTSLDSEEKNVTINENSWLSSSKNSLTVSQPKHSCDYNFATDFYLNFVAPESPPEEIFDTEHFNSISDAASKNKDDLPEHVVTSHYDSDSSDGPFYDCQGGVDTEEHTGFNQEAIDTVEYTFQQKKEIGDDPSIYDISVHLNNDQSPQSINSLINIPNDDNESDEKIPRVRRCSSLKTGKTPPETPGRKKIVRFADVLGLDLADVRTFLDEFPKIPNSAFNDLMAAEVCATSQHLNAISSQKRNHTGLENVLVPRFQQPGGQPDFIERIRDNQVCLDNVVIEDPTIPSIKGLVRVKNLDFHKTVHVRYTLDSWKTFSDVQAMYIENSCDGFSDKFCFTLYGNNLSLGDKIEFAIRFQCKGCQFWDNNNGSNYSLQRLSQTTSNDAFDSNLTSCFY